jgi:hypothetical protein
MVFDGMTYEEVVALLHLDPGELRMMGMFVEYGDKWVEMRDLSEHGEDCVGMLVMEGLVERKLEDDGWLNQWRITDAGAEFVTLEMSGETPRRNDA